MEQVIRAVLVDDDPYAVEAMRDLLRAHPVVHIMASFTQPEEAVEFLKKHTPDLVFLDIQMPGMSGFEMIDKLGDSVPEIIFVTAFDQYAIRAIRYSALDYLLKPVSSVDLLLALARFRAKSERMLSRARLDSLRHNLGAAESNEYELVLLTKSEGEHRFRSGDIVRCEADSNYTRIFLATGKQFLASKTLGDMEELLAPDCFVRIHKSHVVNTAHVRSLSRNHEICMSDNSLLPVSKRRYSEVHQLFSFLR